MAKKEKGGGDGSHYTRIVMWQGVGADLHGQPGHIISLGQNPHLSAGYSCNLTRYTTVFLNET